MRASPTLRIRELRAIRLLIDRLQREIAADLLQVYLFGSRARGDADASSDIDLLLIFRKLPPGREPFAGMAEDLCEGAAAATGVPLSVWSVSLADLRRGIRTPMLVDAVADGQLLWSAGPRPLPRLPFTPEDALYCACSLLDRVGEGGEEFAKAMEVRDVGSAARRLRDDLVRLCTGHLLLSGRTRPRRGEAVAAFLQLRGDRCSPRDRAVLEWAMHSYGLDGRDEESPPRIPDFHDALDLLRRLRDELGARASRLRHRLPLPRASEERTLHGFVRQSDP